MPDLPYGSDHDEPYVWGNAKVHLGIRDRIRLRFLRDKLRDGLPPADRRDDGEPPLKPGAIESTPPPPPTELDG